MSTIRKLVEIDLIDKVKELSEEDQVNVYRYTCDLLDRQFGGSFDRYWLIRKRVKHGLSKGVCAALLGVSDHDYGKIERGELEPLVETRRKIKDLFGTPEEWD